MRTDVKTLKRGRLVAFGAMITILVLLMGAATSNAAILNYYLKAGTVEILAGAYNNPVPPTLANPKLPSENILMWGYALCTSNTFATCGKVTVPGPVLYANEGDTLNIVLKNALLPPAAVAGVTPTAYPAMIKESTSLVINGQTPSAWTPVWVTVNGDGVPQGNPKSTGSRIAGDVTSRVRSFNTETPSATAPVGANIKTYTWSPLKPGTYLYESGTHPAVQVQMGLYGALVVYPANHNASFAVNVANTPPVTRTLPGSPWAYADGSTAFSNDLVLLYSEIDQELHYSIASGRYGHAPPDPPGVATRGQRTSTFDYAPNFSLINGAPWIPARIATPAGIAAGQKTLIRFLNAGLLEKTPTLLNLYMTLIAEDGNPFIYNSPPGGAASYYSRQQYSFLMPAGKTTDAIVTPTSTANIPIFDRSLNLTNGALSPSGMGGDLVYLSTAAAAKPPVAIPVGLGGPGGIPK